MVKKDRWASSSEDEDDRQSKKSKGKVSRKRNRSVNEDTKFQLNDDSNQQQQKNYKQDQHELDRETGTASITKTSSQLTFPLHNPLLQGCRSVYDTYERISRISEGTYGIVWKARYIRTGEIVALKQIKFDVFDEQSTMIKALKGGGKYNPKSEGFPITALREINVLLALSHPSIVNVKEMVVGNSPDKVFMVMELFEFDIKEGLSRFNNALAQSELKGIMQQILQGVEHMHTAWYIHRDLKPSNILVHRSGRVALADFGLARKYQIPAYNHMTQIVVTLWYRAPELLFGESRYGPAIDIWSIGCIFAELIRKQPLFEGQGEIDQIDQIFATVGVPDETSWPTFNDLPNSNLFRWKPRKKNDLLLPKLFPVASVAVSSTQAFLDMKGYDLLQQLLALDPSKRLSATAALNHPYFTKGVQPKTPQFFSSA